MSNQIEGHYPLYQNNNLKNNINSFADFGMNQPIEQNQYIDSNVLPFLTSDQYLKNYTYLEFSLFPNLFDLYLKRLNVKQLKIQLLSYCNTLFDFFQQSSTYQRFSQSSLAHNILLKYNCDGQQELQSAFKTAALNIVSQLKSIRKNSPKVGNLICIMDQLENLQQKKSILSTIQRDLSGKKLTRQLFQMICRIMEQMLNRNASYQLYDWRIPFYIYQLCFNNLIKEKRKDLEKYQAIRQINGQKEIKYQNLLCLIIKLKVLPFQMEMNSFYQFIINSKAKQFYLAELFETYSEGQWYWNLLQILCIVDRQIQTLRKNNNKSNKGTNLLQSQFKLLDNLGQQTDRSFIKIFKIIVKSVKNEFKINENQLNLISQALNQNNKSSYSLQAHQTLKTFNKQTKYDRQQLKQLTNDNVQRIGKLLNRINQNQEEQMQKKQLQNRQGNKIVQEINQRHNNYIINQINTKNKNDRLNTNNIELVSQTFLTDYLRLKKCMESIGQIIIENKRCKSMIWCELQDCQKDCQKIINQLFSCNNKTIQQLLNADFIDPCMSIMDRNIDDSQISSKLLQKINQAYLQLNILLIAIDQIIELFQNLQQSKILQQNLFGHNIKKYKNSTYMHIITLKILQDAFNLKQNINNNQNQTRGTEQSVLQININNFNDIKNIFQQTFDYIKNTKKSNHKQQLQAQIISYPSLQSILYFLSSVMLWSNLKQNRIEQIIKISKYSAEGVQISKQQKVHVNNIISMCQILKQFIGQSATGGKQISYFNAQKINSRIQKLVQIVTLNNQDQSTILLQFWNLINSKYIIQRFLDIIMLKLTSFVYQQVENDKNPSDKNSTQNKTNQENYNKSYQIIQNQFKINYCKCFTLNNEINIQNSMIDLIFDKVLKYNFSKNVDKQIISKNEIYKGVKIQSYQTINQDQIYKMQVLSLLFKILKKKCKRLQILGNYSKSNQRQFSQGSSQLKYNSKYNDINQQLTSTYFLVGLQNYEILFQNYLNFINLNNQLNNLSKVQLNQNNTLISQQLHQLDIHLNNSILILIQKCLKSLIKKKQQIFYPSNEWLKFYFQQNKIKFSQQNKEKNIQKFKQLQNYLQSLTTLSVVSISHLFWIKSQIQIKQNVISNLGQNKQYQHQSKQSSLSFYRWMTLLNLIPNQQITFNYDYIQGRLQSKLQTNKNNRTTEGLSYIEQLVSDKPYPDIQFSKNTKLGKQLYYISSNQYLEFLYQYFPFKISSQEYQKQLLTFATNFNLNQNNHQFIGSQKLQKIKFIKLKQYLQLIQKSLINNE